MIRSLAAIILGTSLAFPVPAAAEPMLRAYIGTNTPSRPAPAGETRLASTNDLSHGAGIYLVDVDAATGAMTNLRLAMATRSPTWLAIDRKRDVLYAANEIGEGTVSAFRINAADGALTPLNSQATGGSPTHLTVAPSGKYVLAANYGGGSIAVLPIQADGVLGAASAIVKAITPSSPARAPSPEAHVDDGPSAFHMVDFDHGSRFVVANDAMQDRIFVWRLDGERGTLLPNDPPFLEVARGRFPRHFAFSPDDRFFYNLNERGQTIDAFETAIVAGNLRLRPLASVATLPPSFAGRNATSELLVTKDGRYVYAANRGHDTIAMFQVRPDGKLASLGEVPTEADYPRSMAFDPANRFVFALNQRSDHVASFRIDQKTGRLRYTGHSIGVPSPASMAFAP